VVDMLAMSMSVSDEFDLTDDGCANGIRALIVTEEIKQR